MPRKSYCRLLWFVLFGRSAVERVVTFHCDNTASVAVVNSGYSRIAGIMHSRCLFLIRVRASWMCGLSTPQGWTMELQMSFHEITTLMIRTGTRGARMQSAYARDSEGTASQATAGPNLGNLDQIVRELFSAGLVPATRQNYRTGAKRYLEFSHTHQIRIHP